MSTFNTILKQGLVKKSDSCNFTNGKPADGCWALDNGELPQGHILCVSYENALDVLPKLIIDSFINKYNRKPRVTDLNKIIEAVTQSMNTAIVQGKLP